MILELLIFLERLTNKDIGEFYSRYCTAYDIGNDQGGRVRVERNALKDLFNKGHFDYRPFKDAIFNVAVRDRGIIIETSSERGVNEESREEEYVHSLGEYFKIKEDAVPIRQIR